MPMAKPMVGGGRPRPPVKEKGRCRRVVEVEGS